MAGLVEFFIKLLIALIFVIINSFILRFVLIRFFDVFDKSFSTASAVVVWISFVFLIMSYISNVLFNWLLFIGVNYFFVYLVKRYYNFSWKESFFAWLVWFFCFLLMAFVFVFSFKNFF